MRGVKKKYENKAKIFAYVLTIIATLVYLTYRLIFTVPLALRPVDVIFGLLVLLVELMETFEFLVYFWNVLRLKKLSPEPPAVSGNDLPDVDVFIATINEDVEVVQKTLLACAKMKYPDANKVHIYLCDDGDRVEFKKLAKDNKVEYLAREMHQFAKAGNYNYALKHSKSPYIAIFDADMRPAKDFLLKTMPFFVDDEKVGFVQTPQSFRNPDIFQARFGTKLPFEQDYFYHYLQLARNNSNSVILCGTNCVISRKALKQVGGFAQATIAEDVATGMLIESKGYRGVAISDILAHGEAVNSVSGFLRQRSRWGRGCIQTAKSYGIFGVKGLSLKQKLDYFVAIKYWLFGLRRIFYMALPLLYVVFGVIAIEGNLKVFIPLFLMQYFLKRFVVDWVEGDWKSATWMKIYELIQAPYLSIVTLGELVGISNKHFVVTKKGDQKEAKTAADGMLFLAHWLLLMLNGLGLALSIYKLMHDGVELFIIPAIWISINVLYLFAALAFDLRKNYIPKNFKPNATLRYKMSALAGLFWRKK